MQESYVRHDTPHPFLTRYATARVPSPPTPGYYSADREMWVVAIAGIEQPLIDKSDPALHLVTKTMTQQETDDQPDFCMIAEFQTKTAAKIEQDDDDSSIVMEMATKTEAQMERDDTSGELTELFI